MAGLYYRPAIILRIIQNFGMTGLVVLKLNYKCIRVRTLKTLFVNYILTILVIKNFGDLPGRPKQHI